MRMPPSRAGSARYQFIHGYQNNTDETIFLQVMLGKSTKTELLAYADDKLYDDRDKHLKQKASAKQARAAAAGASGRINRIRSLFQFLKGESR